MTTNEVKQAVINKMDEVIQQAQNIMYDYHGKQKFIDRDSWEKKIATMQETKGQFERDEIGENTAKSSFEVSLGRKIKWGSQ